MGLIYNSTSQMLHSFHHGKYFCSPPGGKEVELRSTEFLLCANPTSPGKTEASLTERINEQKNTLIRNTTHLLTIQYLWETSYRLKKLYGDTNFPLYTHMLEEAKVRAVKILSENETAHLTKEAQQEELSVTIEQELKTIFLRKVAQIHREQIAAIRQQQINDPTKEFESLVSAFTTNVKVLSFKASATFSNLKAHIIYYTFNRVIQYYVKRLISTHIDMLSTYKEKINSDEFHKEQFKGELINNLNRCLTILNGSYTKITKGPATGTIPEMVNEELSKASANRGRTSEQLYKEFARTIIISTLGRYRGSITSSILQKFIKPGTIVESLVQTIANSARDNNGYSHAMHTLVLDKLNELKKVLVEKSAVQGVSKPISKEREKQLTTIIQQLLELLHKSECSTVDELSTVVHRTKKYSDLEVTYLPLLMEMLALQVSDLIEANVNESRIDELTLQILKVTNDSFMPMKLVTEAQMKETEKNVQNTTREVFDMVVDKIVRENTPRLAATVATTKPGRWALETVGGWMYKVDFKKAKQTIIDTTGGLIGIATERSTYLCALNHLLLIPHVETMNRKS